MFLILNLIIEQDGNNLKLNKQAGRITLMSLISKQAEDLRVCWKKISKTKASMLIYYGVQSKRLYLK
jgi:hypothetical protein